MIVPHPRCSFQGSYVALPTPLRDGQLDLIALRKLVDFHREAGTDGLVVCGTTGESATLTDAERRAVVETVVRAPRAAMRVIAGVGTNDTRTTLEHARNAAQLGVDALLVVTPYYNKPSQRGLVLHFSAVAEAVSTPIVLYNVPSRTGCDMLPEVVRELGERFAHIVAVKEALNSRERVARLIAETPCGVLCGEDTAIADFIQLGALGVIGVVNNIAPRQIAALVRAASPARPDTARAAELVEFLRPLTRDLFIESNPVPVKAALARMFPWFSPEVRLPLAPLEAHNAAQLDATLRVAGLIP